MESKMKYICTENITYILTFIFHQSKTKEIKNILFYTKSKLSGISMSEIIIGKLNRSLNLFAAHKLISRMFLMFNFF